MPRFYLSTIGNDAAEAAQRYGFSLEIAEFCYAANLDEDFGRHQQACRQMMAPFGECWFHAPFSELCPAAIDRKVRQITAQRYTQAIRAAEDLGIHRIVIHGGFVPQVYFPEWFHSESVRFWKEFLASSPAGLVIALENVMEPDPRILRDIVEEVDDPRLGICLDVGHANLTGVPLSQWLEVCAPRLVHFHIHNNDGKSDLHAPLPDGVIPMTDFLRQAIQQAPNATFTVETTSCERSAKFLQEALLL